ncbi:MULTISPECIES: phage tail protein I [Asaia]|uniref:phage tail protein I n=1 Tax=Asaia TaxID=91914 RepID=UPI002FC31D09
MSDTILPPNSTDLEAALDLTVADRFAIIPRPIRSSINPQTIPLAWLPWLAWAWRVENWSSDWSEAQKRQTVASSFMVHRKKGTAYAVRSALEALNLNIKMLEWFNDSPQRDPYTFRLLLTLGSSDISIQSWNSVLSIVQTNKNARSHLSSIDMQGEFDGSTYYGGATCYGITINV